jgi:hypothetical protein
MTRSWKPLTDEASDREIEHARRHSKILDPNEPKAVRARYNRSTGRIELELRDGCLFAFPAQSTQGLRNQPPDLVAKVEIWGNGYALRWDALDVDYTVPGLLAGRLGTKLWMREHARAAGSVRSEAKARAARRNGRKGGRPRTRPGTAK